MTIDGTNTSTVVWGGGKGQYVVRRARDGTRDINTAFIGGRLTKQEKQITVNYFNGVFFFVLFNLRCLAPFSTRTALTDTLRVLPPRTYEKN